MERRHFELIAGCVARSRMAESLIGNAKERTAAIHGIRLVATDLAATLAHEYPAFDKARFMRACGL